MAKKNSKKFLIPLLISALYTTSTPSAEVMKLQNAVESAITTNPEVLKMFNTYEANYAEELAAIGSGFLPSIDYTASIYGEQRFDPLTKDSNNQQYDKKYGRYNRGIAIRQNLFNGFYDYNNVQRLSHAARGKVYELENTSQLLANDTTKAYVDLVRYRLLVGLAEDNYVSLKTLFEQLKLKVDAGVAKKSDLEQAQSRLSLADYNLTVEGSNLHDMEAKYQRLVGNLPPKELDTNIQINKDIPKDALTALTKAQQNNPALVASFEDIQQQASMRNVKVSAFMPRVDFKAFKDANINSNGVYGDFRNEGVGVDFSWNLFRGGADINSTLKEHNLYEAALDNRDKICRDVREQLEVGYNDIRKYTEQVAYLDQRQIAIEKARDAYRKQFEINQRSLIDLLNAENELFEAKRAYLNATHDLAIAYSRTHTQMGTILQALGIRRYQADKVANPDTKVDIGFASCPVIAPTPYQPDRKTLDQRANDALVPVTTNGNLNLPQENNNLTSTKDKKKTPIKKINTTKEILPATQQTPKEVAPIADPVTKIEIDSPKEALSMQIKKETSPQTKSVEVPETKELVSGVDLSSSAKIKAFQKSQGLLVTGKMNRATKEALTHLKDNASQTIDNNIETVQSSEASALTSNDETKNQKTLIKEEERPGLFSKLGEFVKNITSAKKPEATTSNIKTPEVETNTTTAPIKETLVQETTLPSTEVSSVSSIINESDLSSPEKIKEFQKSQGIPVTGFMGELTRKALKRLQQNNGSVSTTTIEEMSPPINISSN
jgi:adhesin transport system outer membrane protein